MVFVPKTTRKPHQLDLLRGTRSEATMGKMIQRWMVSLMCLAAPGRSFVASIIKTNHSGTRILSSLSPSSPNDQVEDTTTEHTVQWRTADGLVQFTANNGELLRSAALRRNVASPHNGRANLINCRGLGTCGTCAVHLQQAASAPPNAIESFRLSVPPGHGQPTTVPLRLACQVRVESDLVVTKYAGFWGQNTTELAPLTVPTRPLGDLEYVLDTTKGEDTAESSSEQKNE